MPLEANAVGHTSKEALQLCTWCQKRVHLVSKPGVKSVCTWCQERL